MVQTAFSALFIYSCFSPSECWKRAIQMYRYTLHYWMTALWKGSGLQTVAHSALSISVLAHLHS